jgi:hypothetical protein
MLAFRRAVEAHELEEIGELFAERIVFTVPLASTRITAGKW